jgi:hypothetical protein
MWLLNGRTRARYYRSRVLFVNFKRRYRVSAHGGLKNQDTIQNAEARQINDSTITGYLHVVPPALFAVL